MEPVRKKYDLIITNHARERWLERIVDASHYAHLSQCTKVDEVCEECVSLMHDMREALRVCRIDGVIAACYRAAKAEGKRVTDISFMEAIKKAHGGNIDGYDFLISGRAVLVTYADPAKDAPVLVTVFSEDMLDGTVFRWTHGNDLGKVFNRWKFERRQKGFK